MWLFIFTGLLFQDTFENTQWKKSNKCNQFEYVSSRAGHLRRHMETHSQEKSNKCNQCNYASSQAGSLRAHLKMHSGEKLNKCKQCDYASCYASTLKRHLKTHSGEKPNKCKQCDYASSQAWNLRRHITYCKGSVDVNLRWLKVMKLLIVWQNRRQYFCLFVSVNENGRKKKLCCCSATWTKTFGNLNQCILPFGQIHVNFCLCEWETKEIVSVNMCLLDIHHHHHDTEPFWSKLFWSQTPHLTSFSGLQRIENSFRLFR